MAIRIDLASKKPRRWADAEDIANGADKGDWIPQSRDIIDFEQNGKTRKMLKAELNPYYIALSEPKRYSEVFNKAKKPVGTHFFNDTIFTEYANFKGTTFAEEANFFGATFSSVAYFKGATFSDRAYFEGTTFSDWAIFEGATFSGITIFSDAKFKDKPPYLHGASEIYSDTRFTLDQEFWPNPHKDHKYIYERLRYLTNKAMLHDEERFFERQIMRCKEVEDKAKGHWGSYLISKCYGAFGDYGTSWALPLQWMLIFSVLFLSIFAALEPAYLCTLFDMIKFTLLNGFGFLGGKRYILSDMLNNSAQPLTEVTMWAQTLVNLILLFLFGLGVRSRFRVK